MKRTLNYLFAALCILAAASCAKEPQTSEGASEGPYIITCTFDAGNATKSALDGLSPKWQAGDEIALFGYKYGDSNVGPVKVTLAASDISADGSSFTMAIPSEWGLTEDDFIQAVFPYSSAISVEGREKVFYNIPAEQDGTFTCANICADASPVYEKKLEFTNLTTILKMVVDPSVTKKVTLRYAFPAKINGQSQSELMTFPVGCNTTSGIDSTVVTVSSPEIYFSVSPRVGLLTSGSSLSFYSDENFKQLDSKITLQRSTQLRCGMLYDLGLMPRKYLNGVFSVSDNSKVNFACGNLYYDSEISAFGIETRQDAFADSWSDSHISHFFWSKSKDKAVAYEYADTDISSEDILFTNASDDGCLPNADFSVEGLTGKWRVLSSSEWYYMLKDRSMTNGWNRYENCCQDGVTLGGSEEPVYGLFIFPDDYDGPALTDLDWKDINSKGIVFLPANSYRVGDSIYKAQGYHGGNYWASNCYSSNADNSFMMSFSAANLYPDSGLGRSNSIGIRLVKDID